MLLGRRFAVVAGDRERLVGVVQWNTLADALSDAFPRCDKAILRWSHRGPLIVAETRRFLELGMMVALEEMDHFPDLRDALRDVADGFFCAKDGGAGDGCALFVPRREFALLGDAQTCVLLKGASQVALCVPVRHRATRAELLVAVTHLKAKRGFEQQRKDQAAELCRFVELHARGLPVCVAGDFNDEPDSPASQVMRAAGYQSAYVSAGVGETYTTSKWREELTTRTIDFLWVKGVDVVVDVLSIPDVKTLEPTHLPLRDYPSDHLSIAAWMKMPSSK